MKRAVYLLIFISLCGSFHLHVTTCTEDGQIICFLIPSLLSLVTFFISPFFFFIFLSMYIFTFFPSRLSYYYYNYSSFTSSSAFFTQLLSTYFKLSNNKHLILFLLLQNVIYFLFYLFFSPSSSKKMSNVEDKESLMNLISTSFLLFVCFTKKEEVPTNFNLAGRYIL